jgi:hypothetical protein
MKEKQWKTYEEKKGRKNMAEKLKQTNKQSNK